MLRARERALIDMERGRARPSNPGRRRESEEQRITVVGRSTLRTVEADSGQEMASDPDRANSSIPAWRAESDLVARIELRGASRTPGSRKRPRDRRSGRQSSGRGAKQPPRGRG